MIESMQKIDAQFTANALTQFLFDTKTTKTKIGEYTSTEKNGPINMVASGHKIYSNPDEDGASPTYVYTSSKDTTISHSPVLQYKLDKNIKELVPMSAKEYDLDEAEVAELVKKLNEINSRKQLCVPLEIGKEFKVKYKANNSEKKEVLKLRTLRWDTNKETSKLECTAVFFLKEGSTEHAIRFPVSEYCDGFSPATLEYVSGISKANIKTIKMSPLGLVHPIKFTDGTRSIIVDNKYLYWVNMGSTYVAGEWDTQRNRLTVITEFAKIVEKTKVFKELKNNEPLLRMHRKHIVPYNLYDNNVIEV